MNLTDNIHIFDRLYMPVYLIPVFFFCLVLLAFALAGEDPTVADLKAIKQTVNHTDRAITRIENSNEIIIQLLQDR